MLTTHAATTSCELLPTSPFLAHALPSALTPPPPSFAPPVGDATTLRRLCPRPGYKIQVSDCVAGISWGMLRRLGMAL